jgi:DNA-cytosine methyltransferase
MTFFDCFYGCGGGRLGFERAGHKCVDGCEIGHWQRKVYAQNFGEEHRWRDVNKIKYEEVPDFDFLAAGLPCQPYSIANRSGARGFVRKDAQLLFGTLRLIENKRPAYFVFENVAGLLFDSEGRSFATWLFQMAQMGYDAEWAYFLGQAFGMFCGHEHIFLIGWDTKKVRPEEVLSKRPIPTILPWQAHTQTRVIQRITTKERPGFDNSTIILDERGFRGLLQEEKEQLLGLPKGWTKIAPKTARDKMLGNLWPPAMAEFIGKECLPKGKP